MSTTIAHRARRAVVLLVMAAAFAPAATAARDRARPSEPAPTTCHQYCAAVPPMMFDPTTPVVVRTHSAPASARGFHWREAMIGFAAACGAIALAVGARAARRRAQMA